MKMQACEDCGATENLRGFGTDQTPLCPACYARAERNYEAAVRAVGDYRTWAEEVEAEDERLLLSPPVRGAAHAPNACRMKRGEQMNQWRVVLRYGRHTEVITIDAPTAAAGWATIGDWLLNHWGFGLVSVEVVG